MHINFKYFIVSIGSIFIALGIGILIGSSLGTNESIQKQNASIIKDIDGKVNELKKRDDELTDENKMILKNVEDLKTYISNNESTLLDNKLSGKKIGIISFDEEGVSNYTSSILLSSGGEVSFYVNIKNSIVQDEAINKIKEKLNVKIEKTEDLSTIVLDSIKNSNSDGKLSVLQELGYIKINGFINTFDNIGNIVVNNTMDSKNQKINKFQEVFLDKVKGLKPTIVAQKSDSDIDMVKSFSKYRVSTICNIDEPIAHVNLVTLINEKNIVGNFGKIGENMSLLAISK